MWDLAPPTWAPAGDSLKLFAASLGVAALFAALGSLAALVAPKFEPQWRWLQETLQAHSHILFGIFIAIVFAVIFFPRRVGNAMDWVLDHTFSLFGANEDEKDTD